MAAPAIGLRVFDTPIGACGIAWSASAIVGVQLPEDSEEGTLARMQRRFPDVPEDEGPAFVQVAIRRIQSLLEGAHESLADVPLDMEGVPEFHRRVYAIARAILHAFARQRHPRSPHEPRIRSFGVERTAFKPEHI